jgi:hypothetical protein
MLTPAPDDSADIWLRQAWGGDGVGQVEGAGVGCESKGTKEAGPALSSTAQPVPPPRPCRTWLPLAWLAAALSLKLPGSGAAAAARRDSRMRYTKPRTATTLGARVGVLGCVGAGGQVAPSHEL